MQFSARLNDDVERSIAGCGVGVLGYHESHDYVAPVPAEARAAPLQMTSLLC